MRIYIAASWRNPYQPDIVKKLRRWGHAVYDCRNPPEKSDFRWSDVDTDWRVWSPESFREALGHWLPERGYRSDLEAMHWADAFVLLLPSGRSSHLEAGWAAGANKRVAVYMPGLDEPELMYKLVDALICSEDELRDWLYEVQTADRLPRIDFVLDRSADAYRIIVNGDWRGCITREVGGGRWVSHIIPRTASHVCVGGRAISEGESDDGVEDVMDAVCRAIMDSE